MKPIEETKILQFASGELDAAEESAFLAQCEIAPEAWRESVLAVAEHRRLVQALGELAAEGMPSPATRPPRQAGIWRTLPVAAAALVIGLVIGILTMHGAGPGTSQQTPVVQATPPAPAPVKEVAPAPAPSPAVAEVAPARLPERPAAVPANDSESQPVALAKHGLEVEEEPTLYVITANNGTRWAVPTERTTLHFVKH